MMRKGFTLIELLAVIVILAVIALIATPIILGIINDTKKQAFKDSAYGISQAAKNAFVETMYAGKSPRDVAYIYNNGTEFSNPMGYKLSYEGTKPQNGQVLLNTQGQVAMALHDGKYCVTKGYTDAEITIEEKTLEECIPPVPMIVDTSGANAPVLATGMIPVTYNGTNWVKASDVNDVYEQNWYDYDSKKWANAVTLDSSKAIDFSGSNNVGSIHGTTQYPDSRYFAGNANYIYADSLEDYNFGNTLTFAIRFKTTTLNASQYLLGNWQTDGGGIILDADNKLHFELYIGGYKATYSTTTIQANTYYTVVGTYDGTNIKLYVNGVQEGTFAVTGNVSTSEMPVAVCVNPDVGARYNPCQGAYVSDVAVYDRALTAGEVGNLFVNGVSMPQGERLLNYQLVTTDNIKEGTTIPVSNMNTMWVWIPRYIYNITNGWHSNTAGTINVQFSQGIDDNWNVDGIGTLDTGTSSSASNNKWTNHPGFKFGTTELPGIWVAKFEATAAEGVASANTADTTCAIVGDDVTTKTIKISPSAVSWRCINPNNAFTNARNMETKSVYGWSVSSGLKADGTFTTDTNNLDTHLMKNIEWGAAIYLSKSQYGKNTDEIWINNANDYKTGCAANSVSDVSSTTGCLNAYNTTNGLKASTTGNIYGIYDMAGGSWERVSAYVNNSNGNLGTYGSVIVSAASKYKDIYTVGGTDDQATNYGLTNSFKGDAVWETSSAGNSSSTSWFSDDANIFYTTNPWFARGGGFGNNTSSGSFAFHYLVGNVSPNITFRPVLLVGSGL